MKLHRIGLHNFRSYGDAEIPLAAMSAANVRGHNGAGKSTLLDAVLFALFGRGAGTDSLDEYVRKRSTDGRAEIEFELAAETYRITRSRITTSRGKSVLEFARKDGEQWVPLTGTSIADTQQKIQDLIRLDFDTFIASAAILQGRADEFTSKTPAERKRVLGAILGLDIYDRLAEVARERRGRASAELEALKREADKLAPQAAKAEEHRTLLGELQNERAGVEQGLRDAQKAVEITQAELAQVEAELQQLAATVERVSASDQNLRRLSEREGQLRQRIAAALKAINVEQAVASVKEQRAQKDLDGAERVLANREQIEAAADEVVALEEQRAEWDGKAAEERRLRLERDRLANEATVARVRRAGEVAQACAERDALTRKLALLDNINCIDITRAACTFLADAAGAREQLAEVERRLAELEKPVADGTEAKLAALDDRIRSVRYDAGEAERVRKRIAELNPLALQVVALEVAERDAERARQRLGELASQRDALSARVQETNADLTRGLEEIEGDRQRLRQEREKLQQDVDRESGKRVECQVKASLVATAKQAVGVSERRLMGVVAQIAQTQERLQAALRADVELAGVRVEIDRLAADVADFDALAIAFSPRGVPAMIVENAVPELEAIANELLARLSRGEYSLRLETQRVTKTAGVSETLDVIVETADGERPYETFSGGERFRIDFALRIAIAKLLARRAGVPIDCLWIDEGIGTQDGDGRQQMIECLRTVREDFRQVFLITHVAELQDVFEQAIEVWRDSDGSHVRIA